MSLYVIAFTSGLPSSESDTGHSIQLESNGVVQTRSLYDRPGDDYLANKGDLWSFSFQSSFGLSCIRISDIDRVSIVENGNNGWNIETIVTLVSDSSSHLQVLTRDFDVNRWIDGDEDASHRRFDLSFAGNKLYQEHMSCLKGGEGASNYRRVGCSMCYLRLHYLIWNVQLVQCIAE